MDKVPQVGLQDVIQLLINLELAMGEFYQTCSRRWPEDGPFWKAICEQELQHAAYLRKLSDSIAAQPETFALGRNVNHFAINTVISGIKKNTELVKSNALTKIKTLYVSRDMENSALESRLDQLVKTADIGFLEVTRKILVQTQNHKNALLAKIAEVHPNNPV